MGLPVTTVITGCSTIEQLDGNIDVAESFVPMTSVERLAFFRDILPTGHTAEHALEVEGVGTQGMDRTERAIRTDTQRLPVMAGRTEKGDDDAA